MWRRGRDIGRWSLGQGGEEIGAGNGVDAMLGEDFHGAIGLVEAEDHGGVLVLAAVDEGVDVGDAEVLAVEDIEDIGQSAGAVGNVDGDDLGDVDDAAGIGQDLAGPLPVLDDEAEDSEFGGVGEVEREDVDARVRQEAAGDLQRRGDSQGKGRVDGASWAFLRRWSADR